MTPILQNITPLLQHHARQQITAWLEGEQAISGTVDDEIIEWISRQGIEWDGLLAVDRDALRDTYLEAVKVECARRIAPPAALGVIPQASVSEVVKTAVEALEEVEEYFSDREDADHNGMAYVPNEEMKLAESARAALSALRLLTFEGGPEAVRPPASGLDSSGADVPPEVTRDAGKSFAEVFCHFNSLRLIGSDQHVFIELRKLGNAMLDREEVNSLIAHLQAWLLTGSFALPSVPTGGHADNGDSNALASQNEDKELLDWLPHHMRVVKADATRTIHQVELPVARSFREALRAAKTSTTSQKGGQES